MEDFCQRYKNVSMAGPNYYMFVPDRAKHPPIIFNTRIYSCNLIRNDAPYRWRGRYNEDTDLSLRILKAGFPTALFNNFAAEKLKTLTQKGGNTDTIYAVENALLLKAQSLAEQHPDCAEITERFGRTHHYVNYKKFKKQRPIYKECVRENLTEESYEYMMTLTDLDISWKAPR
jgi:hypothetical protein